MSGVVHVKQQDFVKQQAAADLFPISVCLDPKELLQKWWQCIVEKEKCSDSVMVGMVER